MSNGDGVNYTTKELLAKLDEKIDRIEEKLDRKVDRSLFDRVQQRVEAAADRAALIALEIQVDGLARQIELQDRVNAIIAKRTAEAQEQNTITFTKREKILGALVALVALGLNIYAITGH